MTPEQATQLLWYIGGCWWSLLIIMICVVAAFTWQVCDKLHEWWIGKTAAKGKQE